MGTKEIINEIEGNYDYSQTLNVTIDKLIGIEAQQPSGVIRSLPEMAAYVENVHSDNLFDFDSQKKPYPEIVARCVRIVVVSNET